MLTLLPQKSRWCKGGMQIFFSHHNAIFHRNISFMQKILWNTSGLAYLSATITTPVFLVVPVIGVWAGFFPLEFNWCASCCSADRAPCTVELRASAYKQ